MRLWSDNGKSSKAYKAICHVSCFKRFSRILLTPPPRALSLLARIPKVGVQFQAQRCATRRGRLGSSFIEDYCFTIHIGGKSKKSQRSFVKASLLNTLVVFFQNFGRPKASNVSFKPVQRHPDALLAKSLIIPLQTHATRFLLLK